MKTLPLVLMLILLFGGITRAEENDSHEHAKEEKSHKEKESHSQSKKETPHNEGKDVHQESGHATGEHAEKEVSSNVGPGKAVTVADEHEGIQLSEKAKTTLEIALQTIQGQPPFRFPASSIVQSKNETGVYRKRGDWFKFVAGAFSDGDGKTVRFSPRHSLDLKAGDAVVTRGVPLLRVADLEAFGGSGEGHGH